MPDAGWVHDHLPWDVSSSVAPIPVQGSIRASWPWSTGSRLPYTPSAKSCSCPRRRIRRELRPPSDECLRTVDRTSAPIDRALPVAAVDGVSLQAPTRV